MILIDTGPLVALCDPRDGLHRKARTHLQQLVPRGLCTCEAVLTETCFHLPHQAQRQRLRSVIDQFGVASAPGPAGPGFWSDVLDWLVKYADHQPDWADACIAVLSERDDDLSVWTYDREFRTTWRKPDGSAIPLAVR